MPASKNSVKGKTRHQQDRALRDRELRSRSHQRATQAPVALEQTPAEASPSSAGFVANPVVSGVKRKTIEGSDQSLRHSPSPPSSRPPSVPVEVPGTPDILPTMEEDLALVDAALPEEARAFLEKMVGCAETRLQSEMASVILKMAGKIWAECPSFVGRSNSKDEEEELARRTPPPALGTYNHLAVEGHDLQGDLESLLADDGGAKIGGGDRVANGTSNDDLMPRAYLATSASSYAKLGERKGAKKARPRHNARSRRAGVESTRSRSKPSSYGSRGSPLNTPEPPQAPGHEDRHSPTPQQVSVLVEEPKTRRRPKTRSQTRREREEGVGVVG